MKASELRRKIEEIPQLANFFAGFSSQDKILALEEEQFTIVNTE